MKILIILLKKHILQQWKAHQDYFEDQNMTKECITVENAIAYLAQEKN